MSEINELSLDAKFNLINSFYKELDGCEAFYKGLKLKAHRKSIISVNLLWALPGGKIANGFTLKKTDPDFTVFKKVTVEFLLEKAKEKQLLKPIIGFKF